MTPQALKLLQLIKQRQNVGGVGPGTPYGGTGVLEEIEPTTPMEPYADPHGGPETLSSPMVSGPASPSPDRALADKWGGRSPDIQGLFQRAAEKAPAPQKSREQLLELVKNRMPGLALNSQYQSEMGYRPPPGAQEAEEAGGALPSGNPELQDGFLGTPGEEPAAAAAGAEDSKKKFLEAVAAQRAAKTGERDRLQNLQSFDENMQISPSLISVASWGRPSQMIGVGGSGPPSKTRQGQIDRLSKDLAPGSDPNSPESQSARSLARASGLDVPDDVTADALKGSQDNLIDSSNRQASLGLRREQMDALADDRAFRHGRLPDKIVSELAGKKTILDSVDKVRELAKRAPNSMGPIAGRFNNLLAKWGGTEPEVATLNAAIRQLLSTHGRSLSGQAIAEPEMRRLEQQMAQMINPGDTFEALLDRFYESTAMEYDNTLGFFEKQGRNVEQFRRQGASSGGAEGGASAHTIGSKMRGPDGKIYTLKKINPDGTAEFE